MELQDVMVSRRSIRKFKKEKVARTLVDQVIEASIYAPSWKNSQVTRYYIVDSDDMLKKLKATLPEFNQNNCKDAPVLIISGIILNRSGFERDGKASNELGNGWGYYDCGLHDMNLLLKAKELGLGTLVMGIRDEKCIRKLLQIEDSISVVSVIAMGYPDIDPEMPKRKTVEDITKYY